MLGFLHGAGSATSADPQKNESQKSQPKKTSSLTGCVDERDGHYLLVNDRNMDPIADLEGDGFANEGFAKHMGHKVTVTGRQESQGGRTVFRVRTVVTVSETCAPSQPQQ
jgi:hypothetical protein